MKTKPQRLIKHEAEEQKTHKKRADESLQADDRFSPEKDQALQTLDDVIQEVEKSLGKIWDLYGMGNWTRRFCFIFFVCY